MAASTPATPAYKTITPARVMIILGALIFLAFLISMNLGVIRLSPLDVIKTLFGEGTARQNLILFRFRLPRIIIALMAGMGLAVSGTILQGVSRNGLADPGILGINAGAGLAATLVIVATVENPANVNVAYLPFAAFLGAALSATLIYVFAWKQGVTPRRLLLVGIAVGSGIGALSGLVMVRMNFFTIMLARIWLSGSLWGSNWSFVLALLPWIAILVPIAIFKARFLNVLNLGDMVAIGLGTAVERERLKLIGVAVAISGACVAIAGSIGFIGLLGPHIGRRLVGPSHQALIPTAALIGGLLLLISDMIARNILAPIEIPTGVVVSGVGAPYFLYLLVKSRSI